METQEKQEQGSVTTPTGTDQVQPGTAASAEKALPQAEVDRLMARTRQEARERLLKELGVEKVEDLKQRLDAAKAIEDATKTEQQKLADKLAAYEQEKAAMQEANARLQQEKTEVLLRTAIVSKAAATGFADPSDAYQMLDLSKLTLGEDDAVAGLDEALAELAKAKPYLLRQGPRIAPTSPGAGNQAGESNAQRRARLYGGGNTPIGRGQGGGLILPKT